MDIIIFNKPMFCFFIVYVLFIVPLDLSEPDKKKKSAVEAEISISNTLLISLQSAL